MEPQIKIVTQKKVVGKRLRMNLSQNKTFELWRSFMPERNKIKHAVGTDLLSIQVYDNVFDYSSYALETEFEKWAAVEVTDFKDIPEGMESFILEAGLYAVFLYKGNPNNFAATYHSIFGNWLPNSEYEADDRPHFEILGEKYKNNDPTSEEEIWIPIKLKK